MHINIQAFQGAEMLISNAVCVCMETLEMTFIQLSPLWGKLEELLSMQLLENWHAVPWLLSGRPGFVPFPLGI